MNNKALEKTSQFFREEYRNLVRFVRELIDDAAYRESEDIVQDVALNIFEKADITAPIEHLSSYVYQALRHKVIDYFRRRKNNLSLSAPLGSEEENSRLEDIIADEHRSFSLQLEDRDSAKIIFDVIDTMDIRHASVFIATEIDGRSFKDLAQEWQIPIGTLLSLKSRSVKKIRKQLSNKCILSYEL